MYQGMVLPMTEVKWLVRPISLPFYI